MPQYYNTGPAVPGLGDRQASGAFDALQQALMFYMKLKDQEKNEGLKQQEFNLKTKDQERLGRATDAQAKYYEAQAANLGADNTRADANEGYKRATATLDNYGGQKIPSTDPFIEDVKKAGIPSSLAFTPEQTLPAGRLPGAMGGLPQGGGGMQQPPPQMPPSMPGVDKPNYFTPAPQELTGNSIINETSPAKLRMAQMNIDARGKIADNKNATTLEVAHINAQQKSDLLEQSKWYQQAKVRLQQMGLGQAADRLKLAILANSRADTMADWHMQDQAFDNQFHADPLAFIKAMGIALPGGTPAAPSMPPPIAPRIGARPGQPGMAPGGVDPNDPAGLFK